MRRRQPTQTNVQCLKAPANKVSRKRIWRASVQRSLKFEKLSTLPEAASTLSLRGTVDGTLEVLEPIQHMPR